MRPFSVILRALGLFLGGCLGLNACGASNPDSGRAGSAGAPAAGSGDGAAGGNVGPAGAGGAHGGNAGASSSAGATGVSQGAGGANGAGASGGSNAGGEAGSLAAASGSPNVGGASSGASGANGNAGRGGSGGVDTTGPPFTVKTGLFDQTKPDDLGLVAPAGAETITIFRPTDSSTHYANGVVLTSFKGYLYAQWQASANDEDAADTAFVYSRSQDGSTWSAPMTIASSTSQGERTNGGWWVSGETLVAYINIWPVTITPRGGVTQYVTSTDGLTWSAPKALPLSDGTAMNGVFEQDPHALADGRIINAAHFQPGLTAAPIYTDDPSGVSGWHRANFPSLSRTTASTRELEPSSYVRADGGLVMIFRDQNSTYYKLASLSADRGVTWSTPVVTEMPDSRAKQSAGNLPDGTAYFVNNPVLGKTRIPLVVTLSRDGRLFDKAFVLRKGGTDLQAQRYSGTAKTLGYNYPKSMVANGSLYVGYATNKEDVQLTRIPLASLTD